MKRTLILIIVGLYMMVPAVFAEDDVSLDKKALTKLSTTLQTYIASKIEDDRGAVLEAKTDMAALVTEIEEKQGTGSLLKYPNLWHQIREGAVDASNPIFKSKGRGFKSAVFVDTMEITDRPYTFFFSLPKGYDPKGEERFPVIIFLHPEITGRGKPDKEVLKMLKSMYSDKAMLEKYIIIAPVGPTIVEKRKKNLIDAGKDWESLEYGRKTAFMTIRILLEQMVYDRSRIILDGMGKAGLSAFRYALWYPSFFSGVIGRDADLAAFAMENAKGIPFLYLSTSENDGSKATAAKKWAEDFSDGDIPQVSYLEDSGTLIEPSPDTTSAILAWMDKVKKDTTPRELALKTASLETASAYWLKILDLNAGLDLALDDPNYPMITGKVDPESNSIILDSKRVLRVQVFLNDKLLDLDKQITVILNGKKRFEGKVERNLDKMLEILFYNSAGDFEVYNNFIEISEEG